MITANLAMEYGISVFAVPGDVERETSVGCNLSSAKAPTPYSTPDPLIEELSLILGPAIAIHSKEA